MNYGTPPDYQYDRSTFDADDVGLPKYTPPNLHPALTVQTTDLARRHDSHQRDFGYSPHATPQPSATRRPTSRGRPLPQPPTPSGPRPMHQQSPQTQVSQTQVVPAPLPPQPMTIPSTPPQFSSMTMSPLTPALTGSSTSSYSIRSRPPPRPSLPPVAENFSTLAPKTPGHTCAGRGLDIVFYRGDATALPMYGRGDRIEGYIDLKNTKDICQIEITVRLLSSHLLSPVHYRTSGSLPVPTGIGSSLLLDAHSPADHRWQFEGMLNITFTEHGLPYDQANVPLFSSTQTVFGSGNGSVPRNTYEFNFEMPTTIPSSRALLPPTWHIHHPGAEADVLYQVRYTFLPLWTATDTSLSARYE